jgi:hypothetical protein
LDSDDEDAELDEANLFGDDDGDDDAANGDDEDAGEAAAAAGSGRGRLKRRAAAAEDDADAGDGAAAAGDDEEGFADEVMDEAPGDGGFAVDALFADDEAGDEVRARDGVTMIAE